MLRNSQRGFNGVNEYYMEPSTPPGNYRASTQKKNGEDSPGDFSPGLLDLHSFDTELLPEVSIYRFPENLHLMTGLHNCTITKCSLFGYEF